jgi:tetratricopeptide (TPR) repeat protein
LKKIIIISVALLILLSSMALGQKRLDYNGYIRSANIYLGLVPKDYKKAVELCQSAIKYYPDKPPVEAHYILGTVYADRRLYKEMMDEFNYVTAICDTCDKKDAKKVCKKKKFVGNIDKILTSKWIEKYNDGVNALKRARDDDELCKAIIDIDERAACDSNVKQAYLATLESFNVSTLIRPDSAQGWVNIGIIYSGLGLPDSAVYNYRKALEHNPTSLAILSNMGSIYFNNQEFDSAAYYFNELLKLDIQPENRADILYNTSLAMDALGDIDSAIALLEVLITLQPESSDALYNAGAFKIKKASKYVDERNKYIEAEDDRLVDSINQIMKSIYWSAVPDFEKVLVVQPDNIDALDWLANAYFFLEEWDKAEAAYRKIIAINPDDEDTWCQLLLIALKNNVKAKIKETKAHCTKFGN